MDSAPFAMAVLKADVSEDGEGGSDGQIVNASSGDGMNLSPTAPKQAGVDDPHVLSYKILRQLDRINRPAVLEVSDCVTTHSAGPRSHH
jgi:hypothetical protein